MKLEERPLEPFAKQSPEPGDIADPRLVRLLAHWNELYALVSIGGMPLVRAFDPTPVRFIIGWLMIVEPIEGGADFRYRLYGSQIAATTGRDLTGCKVSDSFPMFAAWTSQLYRDAMAHKHPVLTRHSPRRYVPVEQWERLILPFAAPDGSVAWFLIGAVIVKKRGTSAPAELPWPLREG
jgi:hypothetical protein